MHISHNPPCEIPPPAVVIFGCGNTLLGDDGFGPAVIAALHGFDLPPSVCAIDVGTGIREYLLDYLMLPALRPEVLIVADAGHTPGAIAGQLRECDPSAIPARKIHDFSLHQFPTVNLLRELQEETGIKVILLIAQATAAPDRIAPGLSPAMAKAVETACHHIVQIVAAHTLREATMP